MQFSQVRQYVVGLLKASFANKTVLDKLGEDANGNLTYDSNAIGGDGETITQQEIEDAIVADVQAILAGDEEEPQEEPAEEPGE